MGDPMLIHANGLLLWYAKSCVANPGGGWEFAGVYIGGATFWVTLKLLLELVQFSPTLTVKSCAPSVLPCWFTKRIFWFAAVFGFAGVLLSKSARSMSPRRSSARIGNKACALSDGTQCALSIVLMNRLDSTGMLLEALWDFAGAFGAGSWFFERKKIDKVHF